MSSEEEKVKEIQIIGIMATIIRGSEQICHEIRMSHDRSLSESPISTDEEVVDEAMILLGEASLQVRSNDRES